MRINLYRICLALFIASTCVSVLNGQGINNFWMMGYGGSTATLPYGGIDMNFISGSPAISYVTREMEFKRAVSTIADTNGNLLFCTNGVYIANASGDTMQNGSGLNPSAYTSLYPDGLPPPQLNLILPDPGNSMLFYLFHCTIDDPISAVLTKNLYYSIIDMSSNGGLGEVISKNQILYIDSMTLGQLTACKHANGRDWWLISHEAYGTSYIKFLITPSGISGPYFQSIGLYRINDVGQATFSSDGSKYSTNYLDSQDAFVELFDFDRCTGMFSNAMNLSFNDSSASVGVAFSPNSQFLYVSSVKFEYQFDVTATNVLATQTTVAVWDSFYSPSPPFATLFDIAQLAPDGKIYIGTGNSTLHLHVINQPDNAGLACNLVQHGVALPAYNYNSLPNHPNYFLGSIPGSPCDSLTSLTEIHSDEVTVSGYPKPTSGKLTLQFRIFDHTGELQVYDVLGNLVYDDHVAAWSQYKTLNLEGLSNGIYYCRITWNDRAGLVKIIKQE